MAKSERKTSAASGSGSRADQVRSAVDSAFQAAGAQLGRERALDLADELASAAQRVREALEELRPPSADDVKRLDQRLASIERRLGDLESKTGKAPARRPATRAAAKRPATRAAAKPKPAKAKPAARKTAAKPRSTRKPTGGSGG